MSSTHTRLTTTARGRPRWLGPLRVPAGVAARSLRMANRLGDQTSRRGTWLWASALVGAVPILVGYATGIPGQHLVTAVLLTPLLLAAVARDSLTLGAGTLAMAFLTHNAVTIALAAYDPVGLADILPAGADYWQRSRLWIQTGVNPEYDLDWWVPAHFKILTGVALFSYTSLGFLTLWQGFHEVDLMNFYVGQLLMHSHSPWQALLLGWHPWSCCRGLGLVLITFEVASFSFQRLTGTPLSTPRQRSIRWCGGLAFLALDALIKLTCMDLVQRTLAANLIT
jgi:hypothetical protein